MLEFDEALLRRTLSALPRSKQLAFMLLLCERMTPGFDEFAIEVGFDASCYRKSLDHAWSNLAGNSSLPDYSILAEECLNRAPDTEEFEHPLVSAALNAALSVAALMSFMSDYDLGHVVEAVGLARDTAAIYAQHIQVSSPLSLGVEEIMRHPLVQREAQLVAEDLRFLESLASEVPSELVALVRERAKRTPDIPPIENR